MNSGAYYSFDGVWVRSQWPGLGCWSSHWLRRELPPPLCPVSPTFLVFNPMLGLSDLPPLRCLASPTHSCLKGEWTATKVTNRVSTCLPIPLVGWVHTAITAFCIYFCSAATQFSHQRQALPFSHTSTSSIFPRSVYHSNTINLH